MPMHFDRALLLFEQSRYDLAEQELHRALGEEPGDAASHALLALCRSYRNDHAAATREAEDAVSLAPDMAFTHYALASVLAKKDRNAEAALAIETALELDPSNASYYQLLAAIRLDQGDGSGALAAAERGLAVQPDHVGCVNLRAMALVKLGRKAEASAALAGALAEAPDDSFSHANRGWTLLHQGQPAPALNHFREALRIDPENHWARGGIVEALKARHLVYRLMLGFFLWSGRLSRHLQWVLILGIFFGQRMLSAVANAVPTLAPFLMPAVYAITGFVLLSWLADPLFNLLLRFNRFGRLALTRRQIVASNWLAACLALAAGLACWALVAGDGLIGLSAFISLVLSVCACAAFRVRRGWPRWLVGAATAGLYVMAGVGFVTGWLIVNRWPDDVGRRNLHIVDLALTVVPLGVLAITFGVNFLPRASGFDD